MTSSMQRLISACVVANTISMLGTNKGNAKIAIVPHRERGLPSRPVPRLDGWEFIGSPNTDISLSAIQILNQRGWITGIARPYVGTSKTIQRPEWVIRSETIPAMSFSEIGNQTFLNPGRGVCLAFTPQSRTRGRTRVGNAGRHEQPDNEARVALIRKKFGEGLSPDEEAQLFRLQQSISNTINAMYPLPFSELEALEAKVKTINIKDNRHK